MEKWRCRGKNTNKVEINHGTFTQHPSSSSSPSSLLTSEKKEKKWSLSGLLKRISKNEISTQSNIDDVSSNSFNYLENLDSKNVPLHDYVCQSSSRLSNKTNNQPITNEYNKKVINNYHVIDDASQESCINLCDPSIHSRNSESSSETFRGNGLNNSRRNLIKARIKAKRARYCENSSSSDNEYHSNCSLAIIHNEDNLQNVYKNDNNRRTRGARTERYMKRLYRDDSYGSNNHHEAIKNNTYNVECPPLIKSKKKYSSDILSPYLWTNDNNSRVQSHRKMPSYCYQSVANNAHNTMENIILRKNTKCSIDSHDNESVYSDKCTRSLNREYKIIPITDRSNKSLEAYIYTPTTAYKVKPPVPPPRSSRSRLYTSPLHYSMQNYNIKNGYLDMNSSKYHEFSHHNNVNCNSLDRIYSTSRKNSNHQLHDSNEISSRHSFNEALTFSSDNTTTDYAQIRKNQSCEVNHDCVEVPIVPSYQKTQRIPPSVKKIAPNSELPVTKHNEQEYERKRHSKNLEEALQELEVIYNSLHLNNDPDLLDRAEQRSMDEYRDKIATTATEGSIKSSSDTSSSYEMSRESTWRHTTTFDQCHIDDTRLKDDMAYRRTHQNERSSSVDPNQMSLSRYSYLANSPTLSKIDDPHYNNIFTIDKPKSRRGTPDLMRDDVVFRTINHANNTLKIIEPQPPFGIPLGPVTTAVESDYLHIEPMRNSPRSLYIPQSEPDVIADDLAFRNLRKDTTRDRNSYSSNTNFLPKIDKSPEIKKKRAIRSLSADLYGIINHSNDNQHSWYKEYVKLNRPRRLSDCSGDLSDNELNTNSWISNREYFDLDINGNRPKSAYQGRVQVCIPQEDENIIENTEIFIDKDENNKKALVPLSKMDLQIPIVVNNIETLNDNNELTEYKELCHNLECLINKISEKAKNVDTRSNDSESRKNSLDNFTEWDGFFNKNDGESVNIQSDELLKRNIENTIGIEQIIKEEEEEEEKIDIEVKGNDKILYKLSDSHKDLNDSPKNSLSFISAKIEKELENEDNNFVIDKNTCTELNLTNNVPYESSGITDVMNNSMEIIEENILPKKNLSKDIDDSSTSISLNEKKVAVESDETNDLTIVETLSKFTLTNLPKIDNNKKYDDCIHESSMSEGEEFENECIASSSLCQTSYKQNVNVCLFNTNGLSVYYIALWSMCLTLLIAIIVAR